MRLWVTPKYSFWMNRLRGLDPEAALGIITLIKDLKSRQVTVFVCTHQLNEAEHYCDHYVFLDKGTVLESGTLEELEKRHIKETVLEVQFKGEVPMGLVEYPHERQRDKLLIRLPGDSMIPQTVRKLSSAMDVYSVKKQNGSLEALYFEIRRNVK